MTDPETPQDQSALLRALSRVLRPLIRVFVRRGLTLPTVYRALKVLYGNGVSVLDAPSAGAVFAFVHHVIQQIAFQDRVYHSLGRGTGQYVSHVGM